MTFRFPLVALLPIAALAVGCGGQTQAGAPTSTVPSVASAHSSLQMVVASSDLGVGLNRFTFGLLDNNHPLSTGHPQLTFYALHGTTGTAVEKTGAIFNHFARDLKDTSSNSAAIEIQGVYVSLATFAHPGTWGVSAQLPYKGRKQVAQTEFKVRSQSFTPSVGSPAPRSRNPTVAQMPATELDSGRPPDDMHRLSIRKAIAQHKPLIVLFATAGYCTSRMCGPEIQVVEGLEREYRARVNFVHIEIYKDAVPSRFAPTVVQWGLRSEPWVFVVNGRGIITAKFDGPTPASEIRPTIRAALG